MIGIYMWTNKINNKKYVGQSVDIEKRKNEHIRINFSEESTTNLPKAFKKYGLESFIFSILEQCQAKELNEKELYWINHFDTTNKKHGYNMLLPNETPSSMGENNPTTLLTNEEVLTIRTRIHIKKESPLDVFQDFKSRIKYSSFEKLYSGQTWKNVDRSMIREVKTVRKGLPKAKMTKEEVIIIRERSSNGETWQEIYEDFNHKVSEITIKRIINFETWKNV